MLPSEACGHQAPFRLCTGDLNGPLDEEISARRDTLIRRLAGSPSRRIIERRLIFSEQTNDFPSPFFSYSAGHP